MRHISLCILGLICSCSAWAQLPVGDQLPTSIKWLSLETEHFKLIFPENFEKEAQRTANYMMAIQEPLSEGLNHDPRKIKIVLNNRSFISNGFVSLQPWRSEFYTTPSQNYRLMGNNDWLEMLATHEYRHVVQLDKINTGFNRFLYSIFGNQVIAGIENIALPDWYLEGDATLMETVHTQGGRGRLPAFDLEFRTNILENKDYSYHKQHLGSFKDYVPDEYRLGYFMTTFLRRNEGENIWEEIHLNAKRWPIVPFIFSNSIKKSTGNYLVPTYNAMIDSLKQAWGGQRLGLEESDFDQLQKSKPKIFTSYEYPQPLPDGSWLAQKSGLGDYQQFVKIDAGGNESLIYVPGILTSTPMLSTSGNQLVWTEYRWHPRWSNQNYSVIMIMNTETGGVKALSKNTKYHSAALDPKGRQILTVETDTENKHHLKILDARSGEIVQIIDNQDNELYLTPRFSNDGQSLVVVRLVGDKRGVSLYHLNSGQWEHLIQPGYKNLSHAVQHDQYVFYNSAEHGIDNIYAIRIADRKVFQVTSDKSGAYNPAFSGSTMVYNRYDVMGMHLVSMPNNPKNWKAVNQVEDRTLNYFEPVLQQETLVKEVKEEEFEVKSYRRLNGLLNIYNWGPILDAGAFEAQVGVLATDVLNQNTLSAGYSFDFNESTGFWFGRYSYQGLFPVLDFEVTSGSRTGDRYGVDTASFVQEVVFEKTLKAGIRIPLAWINSKFIQNFELGSSIGLINAENFQEVINPGIPLDGQVKFLEHSLRYSSLHKTSKRDLKPRWGQLYRVDLQYSPFESDFDESLYLAMEGEYFVPGIVKHHSLNFSLGFQHQRILSTDNSVSYIFRKTIGLPRGYGSTFFENMTSLSINYELPLFYPDFEIGPLFYFQRVKLNGFYDVAWADLIDQEFTLDSYGLELSSNFNVMRFKPIFDLGLRWAYLPDADDYVFELVIGAIRL